MPHAVTIANPGLQALILCGPGSSFPTFTANPDENPKALLPIANRPMVWYPLEFCYRAGITNITLICPPSAKEAIDGALKTNPFLTGLPLPRPDLLAPEDLDNNTGTAEILRLPEIQSLVTSNFVVLPCDLVCELGPDRLLQAWMVKAASLKEILGDSRASQGQHSGGLSVYYQTKTETPIKGEETEFIATVPLPSSPGQPAGDSIFPHLSKLVCSMPTDTMKDALADKKGFSLRHDLLEHHPKIKMNTTHRDAHIYIFPRWVMKFVKENDRLETIGEDVIGWWSKAGWQKGLSSKLGFDDFLARPKDDSSSQHGGTNSPSGETSTANTTTLETVTQKLSLNSHPAEEPHQVVTFKTPKVEKPNPLVPASKPVEVPQLLAYIHPTSTGNPAKPTPIIRRVDKAQLLLQISLQLARLPSLEDIHDITNPPSPYCHTRKVAYPEGVKPRTTISRSDSLVGDNVTVSEKTSIKESVIGANCQIGEGAKLQGCLLMDGVVIGKNCKLTKCIIGRRAELGEGCSLTGCEVQENLLVEAKTEAKDEKFMSSSGLEATKEELDAYDDEDDDEDSQEGEGSGSDDE
ncbi:putative translation initiation factor eIF-2B subunit gamma [Triangularia verruculosa]|uniref:Mannose-1-phosphate guanyltransferase n=1 Tax=Triangularia verruculosa TaxID=2587418 RepID=A0AAN6XSF1_9PEZI|nr:putative translation initiation factor eIF-2B subunit gamma [Triangularia verruculosa]